MELFPALAELSERSILIHDESVRPRLQLMDFGFTLEQINKIQEIKIPLEELEN